MSDEQSLTLPRLDSGVRVRIKKPKLDPYKAMVIVWLCISINAIVRDVTWLAEGQHVFLVVVCLPMNSFVYWIYHQRLRGRGGVPLRVDRVSVVLTACVAVCGVWVWV